jgi:hypothetical protein
LLLLSAACSNRLRQIILRILPGSSWYSISPPLRAPPCL